MEGIENGPKRCDCGKRLGPARQYLYLVLDDWEKGVGIHKIDIRGLTSDKGQDFGHLLEPALRLESPADFFTAMGSGIFISANANRELTPISEQAPTFLYATETATLSIVPRLLVPLLSGCPTAVAVGDLVYVLSSHCGRDDQQQQHSFVMMSCADTDLSWKSLPSPPFGPEEFVTSYAVHPDEPTIFMSTSDVRLGRDKGTYSFDTIVGVWRWHGEWVFPFKGQGYFDSGLDAWVGLHKDGFLCSCEVASSRATSTMLPKPNWVIGKEKLFCKDTMPSDASLICMGENRFCLIESLTRDGMEVKYALGEPNGFVLHLTMFYPRYNKKGELKTTVCHPTRKYLVARYRNVFTLGAFWM